jgi:hypothetical protein
MEYWYRTWLLFIILGREYMILLLDMEGNCVYIKYTMEGMDNGQSSNLDYWR